MLNRVAMRRSLRCCSSCTINRYSLSVAVMVFRIVTAGSVTTSWAEVTGAQRTISPSDTRARRMADLPSELLYG